MEWALLSRETLVVLDRQAARFIVDPSASRFLEPFIGRSRTASSVAEELGVKVSSVLYRIRQLTDLRLVEVERVERRRGRPMKHYRATAEAFFVPFEVTDAESVEALGTMSAAGARHHLAESLSAAWADAARCHPDWGVRLGRDGDGNLDRSIVPEALSEGMESFRESLLGYGSPPLWDQHFLLQLSLSEAKALQRELSDLYGRYYRPDGQGRKPYILRLAMAPLKAG